MAAEASTNEGVTTSFGVKARKSLPLLPTLHDEVSQAKGTKPASLVPRHKKSGFPKTHNSASTRADSLLEMISVDMTCQHLENTSLTPKKSSEPDKMPPQATWSQMTKDGCQGGTVSSIAAYPEPAWETETIAKDSFQSPGTLFLDNERTPSPPSVGGTTRLELRISPAATPQGNIGQNCRLPRRNPNGPSLGGKNCLFLPQL